jgi:shikimate kinase
MAESRRDTEATSHGCGARARAIVLIGFMGAGKTSVGRALSERLGCHFQDLDDRIEAREGRTVADIFRDSGEAEFRRAEHAALQDVLAGTETSTLILALGGGAFVQPANASLLDRAATPTIYLDASVKELWRRCGADSVVRPLRTDESAFRQLYEMRRPKYLRAQLRVGTEGRDIAAIVNEIVDRLGLERSGEEK